MQDRHRKVLGKLVREYITTARPVGSLRISQQSATSISPATIRWILRDLEDAGFIEQPYTSAGRIPTDLGYRHFVDNLPVKKIKQDREEKLAEEFDSLLSQYNHRARTVSKLASQITHSYAISYFSDSRDIQGAGIDHILDDPEENLSCAREIVQIVASIDNYLEDLANLEPNSTTVYIGNENPFMKANHTSILIHNSTTHSNDKSLVVVIGPKRMKYDTNLSLLQSLSAIISKHD